MWHIACAQQSQPATTYLACFACSVMKTSLQHPQDPPASAGLLQLLQNFAYSSWMAPMRMPRPKRTTVDPPSTAATAYLAIPNAAGSLGRRERVAAQHRSIISAIHTQTSQEHVILKKANKLLPTAVQGQRHGLFTQMSSAAVMPTHPRAACQALDPFLDPCGISSADSAHGN